MYRRSLAVAARAFTREPTGALRAVAARAVGTSAPTDAPVALRHDAATVAEPPLSPATVAAIARESRFGAHNYASVPVVIARAKGVHVWDVDGKRYLDALAGYSAVNHGHAHPKIVEALSSQAATLGLVSRAFHSERFGEYAEAITTLFGYDKARAARACAEGQPQGSRQRGAHPALLLRRPFSRFFRLTRAWKQAKLLSSSYDDGNTLRRYRKPPFVPPMANQIPRRESSGPTA